MIESIALSVKRFRENLPCLYDVEAPDQKYADQELADQGWVCSQVKGNPVFMLVTVLS